jgi:hypothetical protein
MNSTHQIKLFDTNIDRFDGLNWCQRHLSLSNARIRRPLSSLNRELKNNKNKLLNQN